MTAPGQFYAPLRSLVQSGLKVYFLVARNYMCRPDYYIICIHHIKDIWNGSQLWCQKKKHHVNQHYGQHGALTYASLYSGVSNTFFANEYGNGTIVQEQTRKVPYSRWEVKPFWNGQDR